MLVWWLVGTGWAQELGEGPDLGVLLGEDLREKELRELAALLSGTDAARTAALHRRIGEIHEERGDHAAAIVAYRAAARLVSGAPKVDLLEKISRCQRYVDLDGSIETMKQAISLSGALPDAAARREGQLYALAHLYVEQPRGGEELRTYLAAAPRAIASDRALVERTLSTAADQYIRRWAFEEALSILVPLLDENPSLGLALSHWQWRFHALTRLGRSDLTAEVTALGAAFPGPYRADELVYLHHLLLVQGSHHARIAFDARNQLVDEAAARTALLLFDTWLVRFPDHPQRPEIAAQRGQLCAIPALACEP
jgi:tetratricopeptide (TPR) repeat protein